VQLDQVIRDTRSNLSRDIRTEADKLYGIPVLPTRAAHFAIQRLTAEREKALAEHLGKQPSVFFFSPALLTRICCADAHRDEEDYDLTFYAIMDQVCPNATLQEVAFADYVVRSCWPWTSSNAPVEWSLVILLLFIT